MPEGSADKPVTQCWAHLCPPAQPGKGSGGTRGWDVTTSTYRVAATTPKRQDPRIPNLTGEQELSKHYDFKQLPN
eukprot:2417324-Amphidinium_carterae.2